MLEETLQNDINVYENREFICEMRAFEILMPKYFENTTTEGVYG